MQHRSRFAAILVFVLCCAQLVFADEGSAHAEPLATPLLAPSAFDVSKTLFSALGFLGGSLVLGVWLSPRAFRAASRLESNGVLLALALSFCFALSWAANAIGLAPIVGAFAAGLILEHAHYTDFRVRGERELEELVQPLTSFLVLACALGVTGGIADRLSVGVGMIPRGEVGLIFANIGIGLSLNGVPIVSQHEFSAVVVMVIVTTMITPPMLKWSLARAARRQLTTLTPESSGTVS